MDAFYRYTMGPSEKQGENSRDFWIVRRFIDQSWAKCYRYIGKETTQRNYQVLSEHFNPDLFKDATLNIGFKDRNLDWSPCPLLSCAAALERLAEATHDHANATNEDLMAVVDRVMLKFYPHHQRWDDPKLRAFLIENAERLRKVANDDPIEKEALERLFRFCEEMWIALASFAAKQ